MVTATERLAKLRRSGMLPGRKFRPMTPPLIGTCRSSGAWLNFGGLLAINMVLLTELPRNSRTGDACKVQVEYTALQALRELRTRI
jgi:hypothetical protein